MEFQVGTFGAIFTYGLVRDIDQWEASGLLE